MGSAGLLVFASWAEAYDGECCSRIETVSQSIHRVDARGCPCPVGRTEPGPLVPLDVDGGRVVAAGDNELLVLDPEGGVLRSLPVRALAAALWAADLAVLVQGELRQYDARTGALAHSWPLPDVPSGRRCGSPNRHRCLTPPRLVLEDVAHGLAAYVLDDRVHVLRLADGADAVVAPGSLARFMDAGLVYVDGTGIHVVPFDRLPLR